MSLPDNATADFRQLGEFYRDFPIAYPQLKSVTYAQWAKESGWGTSKLAREHHNYGGAKWRPYMNGWSEPVEYLAWDGKALYCKFPDHSFWIWGYWGRFSKEGAYAGWQKHTATKEDFIGFIGPIWLGMNPSANTEYVRDVLRIEKMVAPIFGDPDANPSSGAGNSAGPAWERMRPDADFK